MFLLWLINIAVRRDNAHIQFIDSNPDPEPVPVNPIPDCASDMFARLPCWDFFYSPNNSAAVDVRWVGFRWWRGWSALGTAINLGEGRRYARQAPGVIFH